MTMYGMPASARARASLPSSASNTVDVPGETDDVLDAFERVGAAEDAEFHRLLGERLEYREIAPEVSRFAQLLKLEPLQRRRPIDHVSSIAEWPAKSSRRSRTLVINQRP
jgi:hypothetical protein